MLFLSLRKWLRNRPVALALSGHHRPVRLRLLSPRRPRGQQSQVKWRNRLGLLGLLAIHPPSPTCGEGVVNELRLNAPAQTQLRESQPDRGGSEKSAPSSKDVASNADGWVARAQVGRIAPLIDPPAEKVAAPPKAGRTAGAMHTVGAGHTIRIFPPLLHRPESSLPPSTRESAGEAAADNEKELADDVEEQLPERGQEPMVGDLPPVDEEFAFSEDVDPTSSPAETQMEIRRPQIGGGRLTQDEESHRVVVGPISVRGTRQRVGDETLEDPAESPAQLDTTDEASAEGVEVSREDASSAGSVHVNRVSPQGELILAVGDPSRLRPSQQVLRMRPLIEQTLQYYWARPENTIERTHWGMMHQIMVFGSDTRIIHQRRHYNAVAWMAGNNACRNQLLFDEDPRGGIVVNTGVGLQGHQAQLLAIFGLIDVPVDYPVYAKKTKHSVHDIVNREMLECKSGNELTFTLIALAHYIDSDTRWVANDGENWSFERLIREELDQPIVGAACGGTHRLMGFAHALLRRKAEGRPLTGQWARADQYTRDFIDYTLQLQNRDGSMSTAWFEKAEDNGKVDRKIQTTGHMVEYLMTALPDERLQDRQVVSAVNYLANTLYGERGHQWQVGPKGHALRALAMYHRRVFGGVQPWRPTTTARAVSPPTRR